LDGRAKPMKEKEISNDDFLKALKDSNNLRIMNKVCSFYQNILSKDELHRCKLLALWKAMCKFDPSCGKKFTSYLYNSVKWECQKDLYNVNKYRKGITYSDSLFEYFDRHDTDIVDTIEKLPNKFSKVIKQKFFHNMTMEEIGTKNHYSRETARRNVKRGLEKLREICKLNWHA
jgi:RNA polymerase sigma factor (sigma-70 family)